MKYYNCFLSQKTIKILQDELAAAEKAQEEFVIMMQRQRMEEELERQKRKEADKLMLIQGQDLQSEVCISVSAALALV